MENAQRINHKFTQPRKKSSPQLGKQSRRFSPATFWIGLAAFLIIFPLSLSSAVIVYFQVNQLILPGVFVYDKPAGLKTYQETAAQIDAEWNLNRRIELTSENDPSISYWFSPADLGLWVDPQETADAAFKIGRGVQPLKDIIKSLQNEPQIIYPVLYFDEGLAKETLSKIQEELSFQTKDAQVIFTDGNWVAVPGSDGREVHPGKTISTLYENAFEILLTGTVSLEISYPTPKIKDLTPVINEIEQILSQDLKLSAYDPIEDESFTWSVPIEEKRAWVSVDPNNYTVRMEYREADISSLINTWEVDLGPGRFFQDHQTSSLIETWQNGKPAQLIVKHKPTTYEVKSGETLWSISLKLGMPMYHIMEANQGLTTSSIKTGMILDIPSKDILLPLPIVPNKRIIIDISEQSMTVYEDGQIRNTYIVSTGVSDSPTMPGVFQIQTHEINAYASNWDLYMPHFMGIYEAWPGFMNGIHGLPLLSSGQRLWASTLGSPASYGCIILDLAAAEDLYYWAESGVVVEIVG